MDYNYLQRTNSKNARMASMKCNYPKTSFLIIKAYLFPNPVKLAYKLSLSSLLDRSIFSHPDTHTL